MTAFTLRGSTALVALSVSLTFGAPFLALAQATPEAAAPAIAPPPAPAVEAPWQPVTRLGLSFEVPPGVAIPETPEGAREFAISTIGADGVGARMGMRLLDTPERESMPAPGSAGMAAFLSDLSGVPVTETGTEMMLGDRRMIAYGGSGPIPASGGGTLQARMLYLIAAEPDADGHALMVAVFSAGLGDGVAAELEAQFIASLAPADQAPSDQAPTDPTAATLAAFAALPTPDGSTPEGWTRGEALGFSFAAPRTSARLDDLDSNHPRLRARLREPGRNTQLTIGVLRLGPEELQQMDNATPGTPDFNAIMAETAEAPLVAVAEPVMVGGRPMLAYPAFEGRGDSAIFTLSLFTTEPDEDGNWTMFSVEVEGYPRAEAEQLMAQAVASLALSAAVSPMVTDDPMAPLLDAAEALPLPARVTPDGWQRTSAFGYSIAAPADAALTDRRERRHPEISLRQAAAGGEALEIGLALMNAEEMSQMGAAPGTPGFLELMARRAGVPATESPRRILVGDRGMIIYIALGTRDRAPQEGAHERSVYLVTEEPDAEGNYIFMGVTARGHAPDEAETLVDQVIASIAPEVPEAEAAPEPTPPVAEATPPVAEAPAATASLGFDGIAAALPDPSGTLPEGWQTVEALGLTMAIPPGLEANLSPDGRGAEIGGRDAAARTEIEMGGVLAGPDRLGGASGAPGSPEFAQTLQGWAQVEVRDSGREMQVAGQPMRLYIASGQGDESPEVGAQLTGFYLVSTQPDDAGDVLILGGAFRGYAEAEAVALIGQVVAGLPPAAAEAPASPAGSEAMEATILPGLAGVRLPAGRAVTSEQRNVRSADLFIGDAGAAADTRITAGLLTREFNTQLRRMLHDVDALVETEIGGLPVWVIYGIASRSLDDQRVGPEARVPAQIVVPRVCMEDAPPYLVGVLAAPGQEARVDAMVAALDLQQPAGAVPCPDSIMDEVRGVIARRGGGTGATAETPTQTPPAPVVLQAAPVVPDGWARHVRFGLTFAAPAAMELRRERTEADRMEYWLQSSDASGALTQEISIRVFTAGSLAAMPLQTPDQPGFSDMLDSFGNLPVTDTGERMLLGDVTLRAFRGEGTDTEGGTGRPVRLLYLIAEAPSASGLSPWMVVRSMGQSPEAAQAFERDFLASLGGSPEIPPQTAEPPAERTPPSPEQPRPQPQPQSQPPVASTASPEAQAFQAARVDGSTEAILAYLAAYPRGLHSGDARAMLHARGIVPPDERRPEPAQVDPEAMAWQRALDEGRMEAFWTYLKMWPQGLHADEARALLDQLRPPAPRPYAPDPRPMK